MYKAMYNQFYTYNLQYTILDNKLEKLTYHFLDKYSVLCKTSLLFSFKINSSIYPITIA